MTIVHKSIAAALLLVTAVSSPAFAQATVVKYMTFSAAPDYLDELDATIAAFEAAHPDIDVQYETASFNDYFTKLQTVIAAGQAPDAFELNYENFVAFANKGALADLSPIIAADSGFSTSIYNPTALAAFSQDGKQYGLVESFSNVVTFRSLPSRPLRTNSATSRNLGTLRCCEPVCSTRLVSATAWRRCLPSSMVSVSGFSL